MSHPRLLRVDSSLHAATSVSRAVADIFEAAWRAAAPEGEVVRRDVGAEPLPYLTELEHGAMFVPEEHRDAEQRAAQEAAAVLADELLDADAILLCAPLYNLGVPATLKTWLDRCFTDIRLFPGYGITRPLAGRKVVVVTSRGGAYGPGAPMAGWDHAEPYLNRVLTDVLGLERIDLTVELTLAATSPAMAHLLDESAASRADAEETARRLGARLAVEVEAAQRAAAVG